MQKMILSWLKRRIATKDLKELVGDAKLKDCLEVVNTTSIEEFQRFSRRSVHIREVDAGSCNACELEINALNNPVYDIERFGIHFVASPRHADILLVTGPVTRNMEMALRKTYEATPRPRLVVAVGGCARDGGIFKGSYAIVGGVERVIPVDAYIRGCPPRPQELLYGILRILGRI
ncbi:MAG: NADH-quinone oxidoreductase subunit B family protein [Candidatus Brocadiaceae bacterium]|nr:NADH-quinone oxidoreductase subunit B family protein [Candidatus Brocadiaceae bacterium]